MIQSYETLSLKTLRVRQRPEKSDRHQKEDRVEKRVPVIHFLALLPSGKWAWRTGGSLAVTLQCSRHLLGLVDSLGRQHVPSSAHTEGECLISPGLSFLF